MPYVCIILFTIAIRIGLWVTEHLNARPDETRGWNIWGIRMIFAMPSCGGCRTCEMACSFHHTGEFNPDRSSIKIVEKSGEVGYELLLLEENGPQGFACDGCPAEEVPLCVQYCREYDDLLILLRGISNRLGEPQEKQL